MKMVENRRRKRHEQEKEVLREKHEQEKDVLRKKHEQETMKREEIQKRKKARRSHHSEGAGKRKGARWRPLPLDYRG